MMVQARDGRAVPLAVGIRFEAAHPMVIGDGALLVAALPLSSHQTTITSNLSRIRSRGSSAMEYSRAVPSRPRRLAIPTLFVPTVPSLEQ